jgi:H+/Cl- antiporter ClcA
MTARWFLRLTIVTLLVGVGSGISGLVVSLLLRGIQHVAYGYSSGTFLTAVLAAPPGRRLVALVVAGVIGAVGWWALRRYGSPLVTIENAVAGRRMPAFVSLANAGLQVVIVGLGASVGRELAPRELGALVASWLSDRAGVSSRERRILVACGAGAGLAAVYDVPLGGAIFALEILLAEVSLGTAVPALVTSAVATLVASIAVPPSPLYQLPSLTLTPSLVVFSIIAGPVLGLLSTGFVSLLAWTTARRPTGRSILVVMPIVFLAVGAAAIFLPEILGNGRALAQVAFAASIPLLLIAVLVIVKSLATVASLGSGAAGGTLTPALAIGAGLGAVLGGVWSLAWPGTPLAAFALIAAAAFLGTSMRAPFTAIVLVLEFTGQGVDLLLPIILAVGGSVAVAWMLRRNPLTRRRAGYEE